MQNKKTVLVLFGGVSNEHEVSCRTAASILRELDRERFSPVTVGITKDGRWLLTDGDLDRMQNDSWQEGGVSAVLSPDRATHGLLVFTDKGVETVHIDVIFPAVHGQNCEDGALQGLMELSGIPYVGPHVAAAAVTFDKVLTHIVCEHAGIPMAKWLAVENTEDFETTLSRLEASFGFPAFVKPANSGSSVGCSSAVNKEELRAALATAFLEDKTALIEEHITGREIECAVLGNDYTDLFAPTTGEIVSADGFYDYDSKYKNDSARLFIPAKLPEEAAEEVKALAKRTYRALSCKGLSRVDFFVTADARVLLNEINTLPGFTSISMYPKMMIEGGIRYPDLITRLLTLAEEEAK